MTYAISGLPVAPFAALFALDDDALAAHRARRVIADADHGYPCRITLEDARAGERVILTHHVSHNVATPYRSAYAIYVREGTVPPAPYIDRTPPVFAGRTLSLRAFDADGMIVAARLSVSDDHDDAIRAMLANAEVASIHAHNAIYGCFAARIERHDAQARA